MTAQRIVIAMHDFARGGTERIAIGLAKSWVEAGRDVTILCGSTDGGLRDTVDARVPVVAVEPAIPRGLRARLRLGRAMGQKLAALRPDVIFLPGNFHFYLARALRRAASHPVLVMKISNPPLPGGIAGLVAAPVFRHFVQAIDGFAALSGGFAREMKSLVPGKPAVVLHDPIYIREAVAHSAKVTGECNILWTGRLEPQKDVGLALRSFKALKRPAHLTILGDGALRGWTERKIARMELTGRVTLTGHVANIDPYLAQADVFLMTSRYEGQPAVIGEALAHGVPVVSTDCCDMLREVMTIPQAGKIVTSRAPADLAAALETVCAAPPPPRAALRALVAEFEPERCAKAYLDWFDSLATARALPRPALG